MRLPEFPESGAIAIEKEAPGLELARELRLVVELRSQLVVGALPLSQRDTQVGVQPNLLFSVQLVALNALDQNPWKSVGGMSQPRGELVDTNRPLPRVASVQS